MLIARIDASGRYVYANGAYAERHGATPAALVGRAVREVVGDGLHAALERHLAAALRGERVELEEQIAFPVGEPATARCVYEPEWDGTGRVAGAIVLVDPARQREAIAVSREQEPTLRGFLDSAPVCMGVVELLDDGDILHVDDSITTCRLLGVPASGTRGRRASDLGATVDTIVTWREHYLASAAQGTPVTFEHHVETPEGPRWLGVTVAVVPHAPGAPKQYCYVADDLTPRRVVRQALASGEAARRTLADGAAPLDDLLDLLRASRGRLALHRQRTDVALILQAALEAARPLVAERGHRLEVMLPAELLHVDADEVRLARVFSDLLRSSAAHTEPGGHVCIAAERCGDDEVEVIVRDDGSGIAPELLPHVFDVFAERPPDGPARGLGIGLALVRELVELHGGTVVALSDGHGRGTEFRVRLPLATGAAAGPTEVSSGAPPDATGLRVLVADDNRDNVDTIAMMLELQGHEVAPALDGVEAVTVAERFRPQVVLLDLGMPGMDGYGVCRALRALPFGAEICVVAITGWGEEEDRRRTQEAGFDHHLVKPVDFADIARLLAGYRRSAS